MPGLRALSPQKKGSSIYLLSPMFVMMLHRTLTLLNCCVTRCLQEDLGEARFSTLILIFQMNPNIVVGARASMDPANLILGMNSCHSRQKPNPGKSSAANGVKKPDDGDPLSKCWRWESDIAGGGGKKTKRNTFCQNRIKISLQYRFETGIMVFQISCYFLWPLKKGLKLFCGSLFVFAFL